MAYSKDLHGVKKGTLYVSEEGFLKMWNSKYKGPEARTSLASS